MLIPDRSLSVITKLELISCMKLFSKFFTFKNFWLYTLSAIYLLNSSVIDLIIISLSILLPLQVETIGDAYMVVGGLPMRCNNHAERVCNQALDMIKYSQRVKNPVNGQSINVGCVYNHVVYYIVTTSHTDTCGNSQWKCCGWSGRPQNAQILSVRRYRQRRKSY